MTLTDQVLKEIIRKLIKGQDYRIEVVTLIDAAFLQYAIDFFKQIVEAKLKNQDITIDWYKKEFLDEKLKPENIAIHSGLNKKTITNMYKSACREIVLDASNKHYDLLYRTIKDLVDTDKELELTLTIKFRGVSVDLNISESLIVINTLAVKRAALRGGLWSTAGKRAEKYLMLTLCQLFDIPSNYYNQVQNPKSMREVDFYLKNKDKNYRCEVKLMGTGNPESADAVIARNSDLFVADTLSELNKRQLNQLNVEWIELRNENGYKKFPSILEKFNIPYTDFHENLDEKLNHIFEEVFNA